MKKILLAIISCVILLSFSITNCFAVSFSDVTEDAWYYTYVTNLAEKGVINGFPDGTYMPNDGITVGQFIKLIIVASIGDGVNYDLVESSFDHWAAPYVKVGENCEVFEAGEYTKADMDRAITRREIVRILSRCDLIILENSQQGSYKEFTDTNDLQVDELIYLSHAVGIGVINGDPEGTFRPNDTLKRSECAKVIYTYVNR